MRKTRSHFQYALSLLPKLKDAKGKSKKPLVAYIGAASGDNGTFRKMISLALGGSRVEPVKLVSASASVPEARQLMEDADLLFLSGGDVHAGMEVLTERDVVGDIRRHAENGKPMLGISAGSIMLGSHWVHFSDDESQTASLFDCLSIVPVALDCHSEDDGWAELRILLPLLHEAGHDSVGYGVPSPGCLRVDLDGLKTKLSARGAPVTRLKFDKSLVVDAGDLPPVED